MVVCEGFTTQTRVKILCNDLSHSVLCVKAKGVEFSPLAFTLRAAVARTFCAAVFVVPPTVLRARRGEGSCLHT